ncbi:NAD(P)-binding protein [Periconia macrospinosa]|uniref:NAD(P)-binding protein n=1 Tax=Periconia macrospinosa TaxID=97972 RepID=A0A2V1DG75_9PLEO|nr:NAD(P)-binding protein [Periconia macrospinosa]
MAPTYLIIGATGNIGRPLVSLLLSHPSQPTLVLPTSKPAEQLTSTLSPGHDISRVHAIQGSIQDPNFIDGLLQTHGVTGVFMAMTGDNELFTTVNIISSLERSKTVRHVVYVSSCGNYSLDAMRNGALKNMNAANVAPKFFVEAKFKYGVAPRDDISGRGLSWTVLGPTLFFSNDMGVKQVMLEHGVFGQPLGSKGVSRVHPQDIALAGLKALEDDGQRWGGKKVMVGSLKGYTDEETAKLWSEALGKTIKPTLSNQAGFDACETGFSKFAGPAWGRTLRLMLEQFAEEGIMMSEAEYQDQIALLGKEPESYEKFVEATANAWKEA